MLYMILTLIYSVFLATSKLIKTSTHGEDLNNKSTTTKVGIAEPRMIVQGQIWGIIHLYHN